MTDRPMRTAHAMLVNTGAAPLEGDPYHVAVILDQSLVCRQSSKGSSANTLRLNSMPAGAHGAGAEIVSIYVRLATLRAAHEGHAGGESVKYCHRRDYPS